MVMLPSFPKTSVPRTIWFAMWAGLMKYTHVAPRETSITDKYTNVSPRNVREVTLTGRIVVGSKFPGPAVRTSFRTIVICEPQSTNIVTGWLSAFPWTMTSSLCVPVISVVDFFGGGSPEQGCSSHVSSEGRVDGPANSVSLAIGCTEVRGLAELKA